MSVINKMLRDLDSRQTSASNKNAATQLGLGVIRGTSVLLPADPSRRKKSTWMMPLAVGLIVAAVVIGIALWWQTRPLPAALLPAAKLNVQPGPKVVTVPPVPATQPALQAAVPTVPAELPPPAATQPAPVPGANVPLAADTPVRSAPVPAPAARPPSVSASTPAVALTATISAPNVASPPGGQRQAAALDALAQAQSLWSAGARDQAVDILREAVVLAERPASGGVGNPALIPLARELARMLMAESQIAQALDLLTRLEPAVSAQADLWAVRGNAAQRLGRHPEASNAYLMALKLRPGEPRWMLGAAISQALLGQLTEAGDLVEQARLKGALTAELRTYLRQLGVAIQDQ